MSGMRHRQDGGATLLSAIERREGSRLEVDDPEHCKECGAELPSICVHGDWHPLGGEGAPELCGSCLAEEVLRS